VEVRASRSAGVTTKGDRIAGFDVLVRFNEETREVTINSFEVVGVANDNVVSVTFGFVFCETNAAVESSADGVTDIYFEVNAFVLAFETFAITVRRSDVTGARHRELVEAFDDNGLRHAHVRIAVNEVATPTGIVDIFFGFFLLTIVKIVNSGVNRNGVVYIFLRGKKVVSLLGVLTGETISLRRCRETCQSDNES
jgi:hypothetical protein